MILIIAQASTLLLLEYSAWKPVLATAFQVEEGPGTLNVCPFLSPVACPGAQDNLLKQVASKARAFHVREL